MEVKNLDGAYQEAVINKLTDASWYTVGKRMNFLIKMYFLIIQITLISIKQNFFYLLSLLIPQMLLLSFQVFKTFIFKMYISSYNLQLFNELIHILYSWISSFFISRYILEKFFLNDF